MKTIAMLLNQQSFTVVMINFSLFLEKMSIKERIYIVH